MTTKLDEIADGIFRISTLVPAINPPHGFSFNQFLLLADAPMIFHCGHRKMFPAIAEAVRRVLPLEKIRWVSFSHVEADECGALEVWLAAAPNAMAAHGAVGCRIWIGDVTDRLRPLQDGEVLDLGGKRVRHLDTPHLPHGWDAGLIFEETTATLFCSDIFGHGGDGPAVTRDDLAARAIDAEERSRSMSLTPAAPAMMRRLAALAPRRLAVMHGSSFEGDAAASLETLAADSERKLHAAVA
jgi:flavorubredoxin